MATLTEHNQHLKKAGVATLDTLTRRILATFDRATSADVEAGSTWYHAAQDLALELGHEVGVEHAAAVISHLSPRTSWTRNVVGAASLIVNGTRGEGVIGANYDRARASLEVEPRLLEDTFGGPKTRRFFLNILGDTESVTVDVWAARVAGVDELVLSRKGVYDAVEAAYQRAARLRGVEPATMQATTWVVARNGRAS